MKPIKLIAKSKHKLAITDVENITKAANIWRSVSTYMIHQSFGTFL